MLKQNKYLIRQYIAVLTANLCSICVGLGFGWFSPVLVKLLDPDEKVLTKPLTEQEASWIVSSSYLAGSLTNYPGGFAVDYFGRKFCIVGCLSLTIIAETLLTFATEAWMFIVGKSLTGALRGVMLCGVTSFSAEISSKEIRGSLISITSVGIAFGILLMYSIGPYLSYIHLSIAHCCILIACVLPILFIHESPYFLFSKGQLEESEKVLTHFKGSGQEVNEEIKQYNLEIATRKVGILELFKNKTFLKSLTIAIFVSILTQMTGYSAVTNYMQFILEVTGTTIKPELASAIAGVVQVISGVFPAFVTDKIGRKTLYLLTLPIVAAGLIGLGVFFKLKELEYTINGWINYLPLVSYVIILLSFNMGPGVLYFTVTSEIFDGPARASGASISLSVSNFTAFFSTKYFPYFTKTFGYSVSLWLCAFNSLVMCVFVMFFVPEMKGKSFLEIQNGLKNKSVGEVEISRV